MISNWISISSSRSSSSRRLRRLLCRRRCHGRVMRAVCDDSKMFFFLSSQHEKKTLMTNKHLLLLNYLVQYQQCLASDRYRSISSGHHLVCVCVCCVLRFGCNFASYRKSSDKMPITTKAKAKHTEKVQPRKQKKVRTKKKQTKQRRAEREREKIYGKSVRLTIGIGMRCAMNQFEIGFRSRLIA